MSALETRIDRLEKKFGENREPRVIIVTINPNNFPEDPYRFELLPHGLWAYAARGGERELGVYRADPRYEQAPTEPPNLGDVYVEYLNGGSVDRIYLKLHEERTKQSR